ncbi:hypothetical protein [Blastococcus brunescens]|uniref:Serine/threonine protein kinase n=1 Tax=Blastococcus brunescens TaxID=1564165 RepID=A0ABZ1B0R5_9ACTN|nr:hypothetical protein [Blastococcus sp. BMG 8361]WRL64407.1 hypothetical protein U6N30_00665 [Blastococcus sp. BMG 8361]
MLHKVAAGQILPPHRAGSLTGPLTRMLSADPADRPAMTEVRDELAKLAAGRGGDTTTVLLARTDLNSAAPGRNRTAAFPAGVTAAGAVTPTPPTPAPGPPEAPAAAPVPKPRGRRRGRAVWLLAGLVAVVLAGLVVFWVASPDDEDPSDRTAATTSAATTSAATTSAEPTDETDAGVDAEESPATSEPAATSEEEPPPTTRPRPRGSSSPPFPGTCRRLTSRRARGSRRSSPSSSGSPSSGASSRACRSRTSRPRAPPPWSRTSPTCSRTAPARPSANA